MCDGPSSRTCPPWAKADSAGFRPICGWGCSPPGPTPAAGVGQLQNPPQGRLQSPQLQASIAKLGRQARSMTPRALGTKLGAEARDWEAAVTESGVKID